MSGCTYFLEWKFCFGAVFHDGPMEKMELEDIVSEGEEAGVVAPIVAADIVAPIEPAEVPMLLHVPATSSNSVKCKWSDAAVNFDNFSH